MLTKTDLQQIRGVVKEELTPVKESIHALDKKLDGVQEDISEILTVVIDSHDKLDKRVTRVEGHLDLREI